MKERKSGGSDFSQKKKKKNKIKNPKKRKKKKREEDKQKKERRTQRLLPFVRTAVEKGNALKNLSRGGRTEGYLVVGQLPAGERRGPKPRSAHLFFVGKGSLVMIKS